MVCELVMFVLALEGVLAISTEEYLSTYGYVQKNSMSSDGEMRNGLKLFQRYYNLPETGETDNETKQMMEKPRCGNPDHPFQTHESSEPRKWGYNTLSWNTLDPFNIPVTLIEKALGVWSKHANLAFRYSATKPNLIFSFSSMPKHDKSTGEKCWMEFSELSLAHAFDPPGRDSNISEIHINSNKSWDKSMNVPEDEDRCLFLILVHEIGHALGLDHNKQNTSIMFPVALHPSSYGVENSLEEFDLSPWEIESIQRLYGKREVTRSPDAVRVAEIQSSIDLCRYKYDIDHVLVVGNSVFFIHNMYAWKVSLSVTRRLPHQMTRPYVLNRWLERFPANSTTVSSLYQDRQGDIVLFIRDKSYRYSYPKLKLLGSESIRSFVGMSHFNYINGAFVDFLGNIMLVSVNHILQSNGNSFDISQETMTYFNINPRMIKSVFRHTNGKLYLVHQHKYLSEFDEHLQLMTGRVDSALELFNISCIREGLINELYEMSSKLLHMKDM